MYAQLGPALGFLLSSATFLLTTLTMSDAAFLSWGWRVPFLASAVPIVVGFVARMALDEPEEFQKTSRDSLCAISAAAPRIPLGHLPKSGYGKCQE
jgi:MFS family permease